MHYVAEISGILLIIGGVSFADIAVNFVVELVKKAKNKDTKIKW